MLLPVKRGTAHIERHRGGQACLDDEHGIVDCGGMQRQPS
jgi:hypothetical protein